MDGRHELLARVRIEGGQRVAEIDAERDRLVDEARRRAAAEVAEVERAAAERTQREAGQIVERARSEARLIRRNAELAARWRLVDRAIKDAAERFRRDPEYAGRLAALVRRHAEKDSPVVAGAADVAALRAAGVKAEAGGIAAGAVITVGRRDLNFSLEAMAEDVRETAVADIARALFPDRESK